MRDRTDAQLANAVAGLRCLHCGGKVKGQAAPGRCPHTWWCRSCVWRACCSRWRSCVHRQSGWIPRGWVAPDGPRS